MRRTGGDNFFSPSLSLPRETRRPGGVKIDQDRSGGDRSTEIDRESIGEIDLDRSR